MEQKMPKSIAYFHFINNVYLNNIMFATRANTATNNLIFIKLNQITQMKFNIIIHKDHRVSPSFLFLSLSFLCKCLIQKNRNIRSGKNAKMVPTITVRYLDITPKNSSTPFKDLSKNSFTYCHNKRIVFSRVSTFTRFNS
jgi:hypothetical protein